MQNEETLCCKTLSFILLDGLLKLSDSFFSHTQCGVISVYGFTSVCEYTVKWCLTWPSWGTIVFNQIHGMELSNMLILICIASPTILEQDLL